VSIRSTSEDDKALAVREANEFTGKMSVISGMCRWYRRQSARKLPHLLTLKVVVAGNLLQMQWIKFALSTTR